MHKQLKELKGDREKFSYENKIKLLEFELKKSDSLNLKDPLY